MTGAIKYTPYFQLSLSSFDKFLTFAVNIFGSNNDIKIINNFFQYLIKNFPYNHITTTLKTMHKIKQLPMILF